MVMVIGLPGSGKSYFATRLATALEAAYIGSDEVRRTLGNTGQYGLKEKTHIYGEMAKMAQGHILNGKSVVLDATFHLQQFRDMFISLSRSASCPIYLIKIETEEALAKKRVSKKRKDSEADFSVYRLLKQEFEEVEKPHLSLQSTDDNISEMLKQAKEYLERQHGKG